MKVVKLQARPSGKYLSKVLTLPKTLLDEFTKTSGEEPYGFELSIDKGGRLIGEPVFLKKGKK